MTLRTAVHGDEGLEYVPPVWRCRQSEPVANRDLANDAVEGASRYMMAFIDADVPVPG